MTPPDIPPQRPGRFRRIRLPAKFTAVSWRALALMLGPILLVSVIASCGALKFAQPAAPDTITFSSGAECSNFRVNAEKYQKILARNDVKLVILPSQGSLENLKRLSDPKFKVDVGFVQGGVSAGM